MTGTGHPWDDIDLPPAPAPVGAYERGRVLAGIGMLSGQLPLRDGRPAFVGRVGEGLTSAQGRDAAALCALNAVAAIKAVLGGSFADLEGVLRVDGYIAAADGFVDHPAVLDGASETFVRLLGDAGRHARSAIGVARLPLDVPVELVVTFAVRPAQPGRP